MLKSSRSFRNIRPFCNTVLTLALVLQTSGCIKRARNPRLEIRQYANDQRSTASSAPTRVNINTAPANELETLPGIGKGLAERIIEQREKFGPFRRPEHLIIVRGISDKRFRALRDLITVE
jgi:competence ComEA-like helix-hairpin-helix protein